MKRIFTLLVLTLLFAFSGSTQKSHINYSKDSRWFFGINGGATWHSRTEPQNLIKGGYGFTFGHSFGMKPEKLFSWDLRLRYLHGWWGGQANESYVLDSTVAVSPGYGNSLQPYQDSLGYYIPNFRTQLMSGSLELALNTNRLRENTGWNFQIFGGIGIKGYNTKADLFDASGNIYDYNSLSSTSTTDLLNFQDGTFETNVTGSDSEFEVDWMPSFGLGVSYQIAPWVSIGISHKMTWTRNDGLFDLTPNTPAGTPSAKNDIYHYSSGGFKFHLFGGNHSTTVDEDPKEITDPNKFDKVDPTPNVNPIINNTPKQKPIVDIYDPGASPYTTELNQFVIRAKVHYVAGKQNINFKQNGNTNNNFSYNATSDEFQSTVVLQNGQNIFEITGVNDAGQDYESTIIIFKRPTPVPQPPIVTITNPSSTPHSTNNSVFNLASTVLNVDSKAQIKVYFNGVNLPNFTYSTSTKVLNANLNLLEGTNSVTVTATNKDGSDSKSVQIIYNKPIRVLPPVVSYIFPATDPHYTTNQAINVTASVLNVGDKSSIKVVLNGVSTTNFNFNSNTKNVTFGMNLIEGANIIEITGTNKAGSDYAATTIIYKRPEVPKPPVVTFIDPALDPTTVYNSSYNVTAKVLNVASASDIELKINGIQSYNFAYSPSSKLMTFTTNLLVGSNVIEIKGTNTVGQDVENTVIIRKRTVVQAPPVVTITYPAADNQEFNTPNVTVLASVLNVASAANISVVVNGQQTQSFSYNISTKVLTLPIVMNEGANTVQITGSNSAGTDADTRIIIYKKPVVPAPPTVAFVNPNSSPHLVTVENFTMTANTSNIDSKSQISLLVNGVLIPEAQYTFNSNHQIILTTDLIEGNNIFNIVVTNNDGSADALAIVTYKPVTVPCLIPTVGYIHPVPYSTVNDPNVVIDAQINNHSPETLVELFVNGVSQGFMSYNGSTSIASKATVLNEGSNSIKVTATNNCGQNHATFTLNYVAPAAPCVDPTILAFSPTSISTYDDHITVQAGVAEVANSNSVTATINGQSIPVLFDQGTSMVAVSNASLTVGNNTLIITVTNDCGTATLVYNIVREVCHLPAITAITPANNTTTTDQSVNLSANVSYVTSSEVQLIINGISQPFTLNEQTGALSAGVSLNVGVNTLKIVATNSCGADEKVITITREIPCVPITTNLLTPPSEQATVTDANYSVLLHVNGTLVAGGVTATLNGANVVTSFDPIAGNVSIANLTLVDGPNTIVINLSNACSSKTITYTINYNGCQAPSIAVSNLTTGQVLNTAQHTLSAVIANSNGANNIVVELNGQTQSINFNDQTNTMTSDLIFVEGQNTITITVNGCEVKTQTLNVTYEVPCQPITYTLMQPNALAQTVVDANYSVSLNLQEVDNAQQVSATLNGAAVQFTFDAASHILSIPAILLVDGSNAIVITATNACSSETITYNIQYNGCQPPVISVTAPASNVSAPLYSLAAMVTNITNQSEIQVLHNGAPISFIFDAQTGQISGDITLIEGLNTIVINANGCASDTKTISTTYTIPCDPIVFALSVPAQNSTSVADENYALSLVAQNATASTISVSLNGTAVPYTYSNDIISANLTLIDGSNTVVVNMSNPCSQETVTYTIQHDGCDAPVINLSTNADASSAAAYNFTATISNIDNQNQITLSLNGSPVSFTYDPATDILTAQLTLVEGSNAIAIAANGCAAANDTYSVVYTIPCLPVSYSLVSPAQLSTVVGGASTSISLNAQNIENSSAISATLNGAAIPVTFTNNIITLANINLVNGANTVVVTFSNKCSSETITYQIESDQCDSPIISVSNNNIVTDEPIYTFTCTVTNVSNASNITVSINGQTVNSNFNATNGVVTAQMSLVEGANTVVVTAAGCETISGTYNLTYTAPVVNQPCGPRFNPGNSEWEFCIVTPSGTYNRDNLANDANFNYSGPATSAYFKPIAGGGDVTVSGQPYSVQNGQYYLFQGNLTVDVSSAHPGSMGHWEICLTADANPTHGNGNNRPASPCEVAAPCLTPVISITSSNAPVTNSSYQFTAGITNTDANSIVVKLNGQPVPFTYTNGVLTSPMTLAVGANAISVEVTGCENATGNLSINYSAPCLTPVITITSSNAAVTNSSYQFTAGITNTDANSIVVKLNGQTVPFTYTNGVLTSPMTLAVGSNAISVDVTGCENATGNLTVNYSAPCNDVTSSLVQPAALVSSTDNSSFSINFATTNVAGQSSVSATINGTTVPATLNSNGTISLSGLTLNEGANTIIVNFANACSNGSLQYVVTYTAPAVNLPCGPRFNPGNSEWEFCIITPSGTYNRDNLANDANFNYSGPATSAYFKPIAGGGDVVVNGQPYTVQNGQYYLFQGNLTVDVSSSHPGSMGHWEICLTADANPTHGNGNNRPASPCESTGNGNNGNGNNGNGNDGGFTIDPNGTVNVSGDYCTTIKCLGESVVYNNHQEAFVSVQYSIDGGSNFYHLDGGNYVDGNEQTTVLTPAGSNIVIKSTCVNQNGGWSNVEVSNSGSQYVYVLKNGDQVPNFAPAQGQASLETFLVGYVNSQGLVTLGPNDVIYLFELRFVGNVGIDYQDCVMLITMDDNNGCSGPTDPVGRSSGGSGQNYVQPQINGVNPSSVQTTSDKSNYAFSAIVEPVGEPNDVKMSLNGTPVTNFTFDIKSGKLSANLTLANGANAVKIDATNGTQKNAKTFNIQYAAPIVIPAPVITAVSPSTTSTTVKTATFAFSAKVDNVSAQENIKFFVNGVPVKSFTYSSATKQVSAVLSLKPGSNSVKLVASNDTKTIERAYTITYQAASSIDDGGVIKTNGGSNNEQATVVIKPSIANITPSGSTAMTKTATYMFKAKLTNVQLKTDIELLVNGVSFKGFTYSSSTGTVTAVLKLNKGANTVKLNVKNGTQTASSSYTITYTAAAIETSTGTTTVNTGEGTSTKPATVVAAPVISNVNPSSTTGSSSVATYTFKAKVTNVSSSSNIEMLLNGAKYTGFSFVSSNGQITAVIQLKPGANAIQLSAKNGDKTAKRTYTITYTPKQSNENIQINGGGTTNGTIKTGSGTNNGTIKTGSGTNNGTIKTGSGTNNGTIKTGSGTNSGTIKTEGGTINPGGSKGTSRTTTGGGL